MPLLRCVDRNQQIIYPRTKLPPGTLSERAHDDAEIVFWCRAGRVEVRVEGRPVCLEAGDALWIAAGLVHSVSSDEDSMHLGAFLTPPAAVRHRDTTRWAVLRSIPAVLGERIELAHTETFIIPLLSDRDRTALHAQIRAAFFAETRSDGSDATADPPHPVAASPWIDWDPLPILLWCNRGRARVTVAAREGTIREIRIGADQAVALPGNTPHRIRADRGGMVIPIRLGVGTAALTEVRLVHLPTWSRAEAYYRQAVWATDLKPSGSPGITQGWVFPSEPLSVALTAERPGSPAWRTQTIQNTLHDHPGHLATIDDWAEFFGITRRSVETAFTARSGQTFGEWRHELRMRRAIDWLDEGRQAKWVSHRLGFAHLSSFSRAFVRFSGMTARDRQSLAREHMLRLR